MNYAAMLNYGLNTGTGLRKEWDANQKAKKEREFEEAMRKAAEEAAMQPIETPQPGANPPPGPAGAMPATMEPVQPPAQAFPVKPQGQYDGAVMQNIDAMQDPPVSRDNPVTPEQQQAMFAQREAQVRAKQGAALDAMDPNARNTGQFAEQTAAMQPIAPQSQGPAAAQPVAAPARTGPGQGVPPPPAPSATAPGAAPAPALQPQQVSQLDRVNESLMAQSLKALELGRPEDALKYHQQGMKIRDQLRQTAFDNAMTAYQASGDPNAFVPMFNKYVDNGIDVDAIQPAGDGFVIRGKDERGQAFEQTMSKADMEGFIKMAANPAMARAMEAKRAEQMYEAAMKEREARIKGQEDRKTNREKDRFQTVAAGSTLVDTAADGGQRGVFTAPSKPEASKGFQFNFDSDTGNVTVGNKDTGGFKVFKMPGGGRPPKAVVTAANTAANIIGKAYGADTLAGFDPTTGPNMVRTQSIAAGLLFLNQGRNAPSAQVAADIAVQLQKGQLNAERVTDGQGRTRLIVRRDGKAYVLPELDMPAEGEK